MSLRAPGCSVDGTCRCDPPVAHFLRERAGQHTGGVCARRLGHLVERNRSRNMTSMLIRNADGIFTGLPDDAMRATGAIRIRNGRIAAIGDLAPEPGEEIIDASACVSSTLVSYRRTTTFFRASSKAFARE